MKLIIILTVLGAVCATQSADFRLTSLTDDFSDLLKLIPIDQIKDIAEYHLKQDAEFGNVIRDMRGKEWAKLIQAVRSKQEVQNFVKYMKDAGFDLADLAAKIHDDLVNLKPGTQPGNTESLRFFLAAVEAVIPSNKLTNLLNQKKQNSPYFKDFYNRISSPQAKHLVEEVRALQEVQRLNKRLIEMGVKMETFKEIVYQFLGWDNVSSLVEDSNDLPELIPHDKVRVIADESLENDEEFGNLIRYFQKESPANLSDALRSKSKVQHSAKYIKNSRLDGAHLYARKHSFLSNLKPDTQPGTTESLNPLLDGSKPGIPLNKFLELSRQKIENSEEFKAFFKRISSPRMKQMVEKVRAVTDARSLDDKLTDILSELHVIMALLYITR